MCIVVFAFGELGNLTGLFAKIFYYAFRVVVSEVIHLL